MKAINDNIYGLGLRSPHYSYLLEKPVTNTGWFEIITENYFRTKGRPRAILDTLRCDYPISCHGVSLSIASYEAFDNKYLNDLKDFFSQISPVFISDHLCFTGIKKNNLHNLLPFAYNQENLNHLVERIDYVQTFLGRKMAFENLSAYFDYEQSSMSEWDFINELLKRTDCLLLLDLNNVYVNSHNHGFDPLDYLNCIPLDRVQEIHLAGFSDREGFFFDTHSKPIYAELLELYRYVVKKKKNIPVLYEWDEDIPPFEILENQLNACREIQAGVV